MRILILDDEEVRHAAFDRQYAGHDVTHAYGYDAVVEALRTLPQFDIAQLDHDLGDYREFDDGFRQELNGQDVARFIIQQMTASQRPKKIIIHSWNPPGADLMHWILYDGGVRAYREMFSL